MMRRILKFAIDAEVTEIETADEPRFLSIGTQAVGPVEAIVVWCEATPGAGHQTRLGLVMTGESPPADGEYVGTTQIGRIVAHVYRQVPA
jgi:hypothetical protein